MLAILVDILKRIKNHGFYIEFVYFVFNVHEEKEFLARFETEVTK